MLRKNTTAVFGLRPAPQRAERDRAAGATSGVPTQAYQVQQVGGATYV